MQARVRRRVLAVYRRRGWLDADAAANMAQWQHGGGFSVDASVVIHGNDRAGLERLLRYCARPCWASERLARAGQAIMAPLPAPDDLAHRIGRGLCVFPHAGQAPLEPVSVAPAQVRSWTRLIARIYEVDPLRCRHCGGTMQLIAFIVESAVIVRLLDHLGEPSRAIAPGLGKITAAAQFCIQSDACPSRKVACPG